MQALPLRAAAVAAVVALCSLVACGEPEAPPAREIVRPVKTFEFGSSGSATKNAYPGKVHANQTVGVAFEVSGKLQELPVAKGQSVSRGDLIARLDQRDFRNDLAQARAAHEEAVATQRRYEEAARTNAVSRRELDEARARARITEAEVRIKEKALEDSEIRASFDGVIADRLVDNFQNVNAKEAVVVMQDLSILEIRINVPERDMAGPADVPVGRLTATFEAAPGREFELEIKEVVTDADPVTQTFPVTLMMPMPEGIELLPGMTASVLWYPDAAFAGGSDTVPSVSVLGRAGRQPWVWVIDPESMTVSKRQVEVGSLVGDAGIQVVSGLEKGDLIAAAGAHHLSEGMKVSRYGR